MRRIIVIDQGRLRILNSKEVIAYGNLIFSSIKEKNPNVKVVAVEPASSPVLSKGTAGAGDSIENSSVIATDKVSIKPKKQVGYSGGGREVTGYVV